MDYYKLKFRRNGQALNTSFYCNGASIAQEQAMHFLMKACISGVCTEMQLLDPKGKTIYYSRGH